jgi:hypothetical protein
VEGIGSITTGTSRGVAAIGDHAFLGDCQGAALVSSDGSVDWWCPPRFDVPSVFARLLGGMLELAKTLALEVAPMHMNVNNIGPGMVLTPFNQRAIDDPQYLKEQVQSIPWKRAAQPEEIAKLAVFLASDDADYVTGSTYFMDGGLMQNQGQGA